MMIPGVIAFHLYGAVGGEGGLASIDLAYPQLIRDVLPVYAMGFFLAVLLGAVFSSFNSLLNSAATLFCLDVYVPFQEARTGKAVSDRQLLKVAKRASIVIALFSFVVAPLLQFAPDGLWQIIRIFTGFYNIPVIAIVMVGLFTQHVPALGPKLVIGFHIIAYGLLKFVFDPFVTLHFLHLYGILFFLEVGIMLWVGHLYPRAEAWSFTVNNKVDMQPWRFAVPCATLLMSCVVALYLLFSPIGLVGGLSEAFWPMILALVSLNMLVLWRSVRSVPATTLDFGS
jgi:SSS family solute:Na+ symporter